MNGIHSPTYYNIFKFFWEGKKMFVPRLKKSRKGAAKFFQYQPLPCNINLMDVSSEIPSIYDI